MNIKSISLAVVITATTLMSCNGQKGKNDVKLSNAADSTSYAIGLSIGTNPANYPKYALTKPSDGRGMTWLATRSPIC